MANDIAREGGVRLGITFLLTEQPLFLLLPFCALYLGTVGEQDLWGIKSTAYAQRAREYEGSLILM